MRSAITSGDVEALGQVAHRFTSGSGSIGAMRVMELSEQLQSLGRSGAMDGAAELTESLDAALRDALTALAALWGDAAAYRPPAHPSSGRLAVLASPCADRRSPQRSLRGRSAPHANAA